MSSRCLCSKLLNSWVTMKARWKTERGRIRMLVYYDSKLYSSPVSFGSSEEKKNETCGKCGERARTFGFEIFLAVVLNTEEAFRRMQGKRCAASGLSDYMTQYECDISIDFNIKALSLCPGKFEIIRLLYS